MSDEAPEQEPVGRTSLDFRVEFGEGADLVSVTISADGVTMTKRKRSVTFGAEEFEHVHRLYLAYQAAQEAAVKELSK